MNSNGRSTRPEITIGTYPEISLSDAREEAFKLRQQIKKGTDPLIERKRSQWSQIKTIEQLFNDWYKNDLKDRLKYPNIPKRVYLKDIDPVIGQMNIIDVKALDIREILRRINESSRPTIANDALMYLKQLFRHANKLDLTQNNPAAAFRVSDAGGLEQSRDRALSEAEIAIIFKVFRENNVSFTRENYLACCLYIVLGVRNSELC